MKKLFFLLSFFALGALTTVNAQEATSTKKSCAKTCAKSKKSCSKSASMTSVASAIMTADQAAEANENIERRVCSHSGNVSYYEKSTCPMSGKVSYTHVSYDEGTGQFVNARADFEGDKTKACSKSKKACAKSCKKGKEKSVSGAALEGASS